MERKPAAKTGGGAITDQTDDGRVKRTNVKT
jgi:hypothetical protein